MAYSLPVRLLRSQVVLKQAEKKLKTGRRQRGESSSHTPAGTHWGDCTPVPSTRLSTNCLPGSGTRPRTKALYHRESRGGRALHRHAIGFVWSRTGGNILHEFTSALRALPICLT